MGNKLVLVIGGNFGGLTAALEVKAELGDDVDVTVVSAAERFLFNPSLIWLPFGKRSASNISFPLRPVFDAHGIGFVHAEATAIEPAARTVTTTSGRYNYDYLVIATGYRNKFDVLRQAVRPPGDRAGSPPGRCLRSTPIRRSATRARRCRRSHGASDTDPVRASFCPDRSRHVYRS